MAGNAWAGCFTALVTPFESTGVNPPVNWTGFETLIGLAAASGIAGVIPCGTTGESPTLTHDEKLKAIQTCVQHSSGGLKVIAGTGGNCTRDAVQFTKQAEDVGAHASLQVCPYYNKPNQEGLFRHYSSIATAVDIPILLYNVPGRTGRDIAPETMARLAGEHSNIVGVKEASGKPEVWARVRELAGEEFTILSGNDSDTFRMMRDFGATGVISVASNVYPKVLSDFTGLGLAGEFASMEKEHLRLMPFFDALFIDTNPIMVKEGMNALGLPAGGFRLPLCGTSEDKRNALVRVMAETKGL